jgi:peptide deformylase
VSLRAFCLDVSENAQVRKKGWPHHGLVVLFDPELLLSEGSEVRREGCMSVPDFTADVRRALRVVVRGTDEHGKERVIEAEGFEARAFQHELDHLDGKLILDRVASLRTDVFRRKTYETEALMIPRRPHRRRRPRGLSAAPRTSRPRTPSSGRWQR